MAEVDLLDECMLSGLNRKELTALKQKCFIAIDWPEPGDCGVYFPEMKEWQRRLDRLDSIMDRIDVLLDPEEAECDDL